MSRMISLVAFTLGVALAAAPVFAADEHNTVSGLTLEGAPLGLHGVDPVAFIEIGNRIQGTAAYTAVHDGVAYYFATEANMEAFEDTPERYVPAFGGFCAYGVSVGKKFDGDPQYAAIFEGRLYVFVNEEILRLFQEDRAGTISSAETNWTEIEHIAALEL